ncbi:hypothetical protein EYF80_053455 [Liparis tanakae]|uniref:Uncharacterized protein n=1 Tax=Liparis tanakae TaxID=230148 RepID=A0A4Z2F6H2_9TELE|nr:hypothetical protein EYF80_053455 [Liparis tanakae]
MADGFRDWLSINFFHNKLLPGIGRMKIRLGINPVDRAATSGPDADLADHLGHRKSEASKPIARTETFRQRCQDTLVIRGEADEKTFIYSALELFMELLHEH